MTDQLDTATALTPRQIARRTASAPGRVTGRLRRALDAMALDGITDNAAAVQTGITVTALRLALLRPHVRAYYRQQLDVARTRESGANIRRLVEIRDAANNMPAVQAIRMLERIDEDSQRDSGRAPIAPGLVIVVNNGAAPMPHSPTIEAKPLTDNDDVGQQLARGPIVKTIDRAGS